MRVLFTDLKRKKYLRGLPTDAFAKRAAHFLATLNAIHPFREGNGRTQTTFLVVLADHAGHPVDLEKLVAKRFLAAMVKSFAGDEGPLVTQIKKLIS